MSYDVPGCFLYDTQMRMCFFQLGFLTTLANLFNHSRNVLETIEILKSREHRVAPFSTLALAAPKISPGGARQTQQHFAQHSAESSGASAHTRNSDHLQK